MATSKRPRQRVGPTAVSPADVLRNAARHGLDAAALGALLRCFTEWFSLSRLGTLRLLVEAGLVGQLESAEFVDALGSRLLRSRHLVTLVFHVHAGSPGPAIRALTAFAAAGALHCASETTAEALRLGTRNWPLGARAMLVTALAAEADTFSTAGAILRALLEGGGVEPFEPEDASALLVRVLRSPDVRDLAGDPRDLSLALPDWAAEVRASGLLALDATSDADDSGNLAGFVVGDADSLVYDTDAESAAEATDDDHDENEDDDDEPSSSSSDSPRANPSGASAAGARDAVSAANANRRQGANATGGTTQVGANNHRRHRLVRPGRHSMAASRYIDGGASVGSATSSTGSESL